MSVIVKRYLATATLAGDQLSQPAASFSVSAGSQPGVSGVISQLAGGGSWRNGGSRRWRSQPPAGVSARGHLAWQYRCITLALWPPCLPCPRCLPLHICHFIPPAPLLQRRPGAASSTSVRRVKPRTHAVFVRLHGIAASALASS